MSGLHPWRGVRPWNRHSFVLIVSGFAYVGVGLTYLLANPTQARAFALELAFYIAPIEFWAGLFIFSGILTVISSKWPPISETWGYSILAAISSAWASFYILSIFLLDSPASNLSAGLVWGLIAFMWWGISGLRNPVRA